MLDALANPARLQRSHGRAAVRLSAGSRLVDLAQQGSAKAFLPRVTGPVPEVVFLNTSGGLTGQDRLAFDLTLDAGARATGLTQAAERAYRNHDGPARLTVTASVGAGGRLDWLPQETLLYEDADLQRTTTIDLAGDAACLVLESVVLGRHAMGEAPTRARLFDRRIVTRDARPLWAEAVEVTPETLAQSARPALLGPARAFASLALVARGAEDALAPVRALLDEPGCIGAASAMDGRCLIRLLARDGWPLRRQIARLLDRLAQAPLSRVWQMQGIAR